MDRPLSRQPACGHCGHEEHVFFGCDHCPCGVHNPPGIYPEATPIDPRPQPCGGCPVMGRTSLEVGVMPRETVVPSQPTAPPVANAAGTPHPEGRTEPRHGLSVGWNKIGWVQIHMVPDQWESTGDWTIVDLDRGSINALIRTLRKARDAAYGSDA